MVIRELGSQEKEVTRCRDGGIRSEWNETDPRVCNGMQIERQQPIKGGFLTDRGCAENVPSLMSQHSVAVARELETLRLK